MGSRGTSFRFNVILGNAKHLVGEIRDGSEDAQVPIILSAASLEAFMHEFAWLLGSNILGARGDSKLETLKEALDDLEASRAPLLTKIRIAYYLLTGDHLLKGSSPHQELALLLRIRNELVHPKLATFDAEKPNEKHGFELVRALSALKVIPANTEKSGKAWTKDALVRATATWAVHVAHDTMVDLVSKLPREHDSRETFEYVLMQFKRLPEPASAD